MTPETPASPSASPAEPFAMDDDALMLGAALFREPVVFDRTAVSIATLPPASRTEIAFAGRSNVGKSSLINALLERKALARTSNTPGRTQALNFFNLGNRFALVDMPGYGYARASKSAIKAWTELIFSYLRGRATLARVILLIDARHGVKPGDEEAMNALDAAAVSYQAVLTKIDKIAPSARVAVLERTAATLARHPAAHPHILATSARERSGLEALRAAIAALGTTAR